MGLDGIALVALVAGVPAGLFGLLLGLARVESNIVEPGERAAVVTALVNSNRDPDDVESTVSRLFAPLDPPSSRTPEQV